MGGRSWTPHHRAPKSPFQISLNADFPFALRHQPSHFLQAGMWFLLSVGVEKGRRYCWRGANSLPPSLLLLPQ